MPELPEVESVRRELAPILEGSHVARVLLRRSNLRRPFPLEFDRRITGTTVLRLTRRAKYLLADLSSRDTLIMHLGMSGSFRVEPSDHVPESHDHVVFDLSSGAIVTFNDPRRFGLMDLVDLGEVDSHQAFRSMGPEPLDDAFDAAALARACAGKRAALKVVLLDQRRVAGVGNIYASEALHRAALSPRRRAATIATPGGAPRESAFRLAAAIKAVLQDAVTRQSRGSDSRFVVYEREGKPCPRRGCTGTIRRIAQAGRSTYYCPTCQR